jgi:hypothetical protein
MTRILSVLIVAGLLAACGDIHYSDSEMSNVQVPDDKKGEHPDEPIEE